MFTSRVTKTFDLPSGVSVTIKKLTPKALHKAAVAAQQESMRALIDMGGAAFMKEWHAIQAAQKPPVDDPNAPPSPVPPVDPMAGYDRVVLAEAGVTAWTADVALSAEAIADLDEEPLDLIARAVLQLSKPALFQTAEEAEAATKND